MSCDVSFAWRGGRFGGPSAICVAAKTRCADALSLRPDELLRIRLLPVRTLDNSQATLVVLTMLVGRDRDLGFGDGLALTAA
jgi:hypothetical protein